MGTPGIPAAPLPKYYNVHQRHHDLSALDRFQLESLLKSLLEEDNFITQTDSYKFTHHLLIPKEIVEVYSYMESRGGEYDYSMNMLLQYYLQRYMTGVRVNADGIREAEELAAAHFGNNNVFNKNLWLHILDDCGGKLPLKIRAADEGIPVPVRNVMLDVHNTTKKSPALTNISETLLMKLWAPNTVATYARTVKEIMYEYWEKTSDIPVEAVDFFHHCFGYRGVSSEETARICGASALGLFKGSDTFGAVQLLRNYYGEPMAAHSVIATEHSVVCLFERDHEYDAYGYWIGNIPTGILSLVSDTYNIYNVCDFILPGHKEKILARKNPDGSQAKVVVRLDSGDPIEVMFGTNGSISEQAYDEKTLALAKEGVFNILGRHFGYTVNSKGYKVLNPAIGVLQGDGVSKNTIKLIYEAAVKAGWCVSNIVFGSGGKYLQAHDRDEQKYAIKAAEGVHETNGAFPVMKDPITDAGKRSKSGRLILLNEGGKLVTKNDPALEHLNMLRLKFLDGNCYNLITWDQVRENASIKRQGALKA